MTITTITGTITITITITTITTTIERWDAADRSTGRHVPVPRRR